MTDDKRIDDDWKRRASEEKAKIAAEFDDTPSETEPGGGSVEPDPLFPAVIQQIAYPALMALGQIPDPRTGERMLDLNLAKETIDLLVVLEKKTRGNRAAEEDQMLRDLVRDLQLAYSQTAQAAQKAATEGSSDNPTE
ncbi:MAG: DUF1844 domain-containing protein [Planctomycetota bacterium]|nr:DUF1844 domain-containing protein [Planctomycetota bacterium]